MVAVARGLTKVAVFVQDEILIEAAAAFAACSCAGSRRFLTPMTTTAVSSRPKRSVTNTALVD